MKTFEQQVSEAQGKDTTAAGHAESKSNTELPECSTLGIAETPEGCQQYCTENSLGSSNFSQTNNNGATGVISKCGCTQEVTTNKDVCAADTEGKSCADLGITTQAACYDVCGSMGLTQSIKVESEREPFKLMACTCYDGNGSGFSCNNYVSRILVCIITSFLPMCDSYSPPLLCALSFPITGYGYPPQSHLAPAGLHQI